MLTAKDLSGMLAKKALDVARYLLPSGHKEGNEWCAGDISGSAGKSLKVHLSGEKSGIWSDFATGEGGDLIDLWVLNRQITIIDALKECTRYLGITQATLSSCRPSNYAVPKQDNYEPLHYKKPVFEYLQNRGLSFDTIQAFKLQERESEIVFPYYVGETIVAAKYMRLERPNGKKQIFTEKDCEPCLFGWQTIPSSLRKVAITEGEIDAMSLFQYGHYALSVPFGGGSGKKQQWIENEYDRLSQFDEIFICMDMDKPGQEAAHAIIARLGTYRCRLVELPLKDANECLDNGLTKGDIDWFFKNAKSFDPKELKTYTNEMENINEWITPGDGIEIGYHAPWKKTHENILFRPNELSIWTGINGHGKSQFVGHILVDMIKQGAKVCLASLEMRPKIFLGRMTKQITAMCDPSYEYITSVEEWLAGKLWYVNVLGKIDIKRLIEVFTYAKSRYDVDVFLIDSLMMVKGVHTEDFKSQEVLIQDLCDFKNNHDCQVHLIVHPRKSADEQGVPGKMDVKGAGTITDAADNIFSLWRNKKKEHIKEQYLKGAILSQSESECLNMPDTIWHCDKQRNGDWEGKYGLWFDRKSLQYLEREGDKPKRYVQYAKTQD
jgi:twinkle protein